MAYRHTRYWPSPRTKNVPKGAFLSKPGCGDPVHLDRSGSGNREPRADPAGKTTTAAGSDRRAERRGAPGAASGPLEIRVVAGVDLDRRAGLDELRNHDLEAGLEGRRLVGGRCRRTLHSGLGVRDLERHGVRQLDSDGVALVEVD